MKKIHFETDKGEMVAELYDDDAPETVANFVGLATGEKEWTDPKTNQKHKGTPYFDGLRFHRVVSNFVIQGGDPFTRYDDMKARWGTGGPGFKIKDELSGKKQVHKRGSLRFWLVLLTLISTAVIVTIAMFETLYYVMG